MSYAARAAKEKLAQRWQATKRHAAKVADSLANYLTSLGTEQDATIAGRPTGLMDRLTQAELATLYVVDDLARRIVEELVDDAVRAGWEIYDPSGAVELKYPAHLDVAARFQEAGYMGRMLGRSALLMVPYDTTIDLSQPRPPGDMGIVNLLCVSGDEITPVAYEGDPRNKRYGRASNYQIAPGNSATLASEWGEQAKLQNVHWSWLLMFEGNMVPSHMRALLDDSEDSVLQSVWQVLRRFLQTEQALATIVTKFETATISISGLQSALAARDGTELIQRRMGLFTQSLSLLNAALIDADAGEKYERKFAQVAGLEAIWDRMAHSVAKAAGIPMTQLFGMSPSGLGTDDKSGRANWRKRVAAYRLTFLAPNLQALASACGVDGVLVEFPPLDEVTPEELAVMDESFARLATQAIGAGWLTVEEVRTMARRKGFRIAPGTAGGNWLWGPAAPPAIQPGQFANMAAIQQLPETPGGGVSAL